MNEQYLYFMVDKSGNWLVMLIKLTTKRIKIRQSCAMQIELNKRVRILQKKNQQFNYNNFRLIIIVVTDTWFVPCHMILSL